MIVSNLTKVRTEDGSDTLYSNKFQDTYHSRHGARQETEHIFIDAGLRYASQNKTSLKILEMGFGTGLNALCTCQMTSIPVEYTTIELEPLSKDIWQSLNYIDDQDIFLKLHQSSWNTSTVISSNFKLHKIQTDIHEFQTEDSFDLIYYDAFSPDVQPELWTEDVFQNMYAMLGFGGVLVTYSAKGAVRRALTAVGFNVERLPGPPGKREFLRALK